MTTYINYYGKTSKQAFSNTKAHSEVIHLCTSEIGKSEITDKIKNYAKSKGLTFVDIYIVRQTKVYKRKTRKGKWKYSHITITGKTINKDSEISWHGARMGEIHITNSKMFYFRF